MKKILFLLPLFALTACDNAVADAVKNIEKFADSDLKDGKPITADVASLDSFKDLSALGPDHVIFKTGEKFTVVATGDADAISQLRYVIKDGTLKVGRVDSKGWKDNVATITVTAPSLSGISLAGSGDLTADKLSGPEVAVRLAGSGDLKVAQIETDALKGSLAGSGNIDLAGKAKTANYSIAGSGDLNGAGLSAGDAKISIAGSGNANLNASGTVKASIAGSGDVNVTGGGKCETSTVGSGQVHCS